MIKDTRSGKERKSIAWSDEVLQVVSSGLLVPVEDARRKTRAQPARRSRVALLRNRPRPERAQQLATAWAMLFGQKVREQVAPSQGLNSFIRVEETQVMQPPVSRSISLGTYLLSGALAFLALSALGVLFFLKPQ